MPDIPKTPTPAPGEIGTPGSGVRISEEADEEVEDTTEPGALAPLNHRLIAAVIDMLVGMSLYWVFLLLPLGKLDSIAWLLPVAYMIIRDSLPFLKGQSVGKMAMKIRVEKNTGGDLVGDWRTALIRNILWIASPFGPLVEVIVLTTRDNGKDRGKRLGDEWAGTKVVNTGDASDAPPETDQG